MFYVGELVFLLLQNNCDSSAGQNQQSYGQSGEDVASGSGRSDRSLGSGGSSNAGHQTLEVLNILDLSVGGSALSVCGKSHAAIGFNIVGSISKVTSYKFHLLSEETEYDYYDDLRTPEKKTVKTYVGNDIYAEKTYFSADGKKTRHCKFLNGEIIEDTYYDENGNVIKDGGETIED